ncbi:MAG: macrocin O-methyltransferase [Candidatus Omnitrophica bacterium]|nr:macrocin O-methyltransferase [Candidatus Omnitrophota bacterium]
MKHFIKFIAPWLSKVKSFLLKFRIHRLFGNSRHFFIYVGNLLELSYWCDINNKSKHFYADRYDLYSHLINLENLAGDIDYLEFGVAEGDSIRWWLAHNKNQNSRFFGFDSFDGLPEDWGVAQKGTFSTGGQLPVVNDTRCTFIKGFFQDSISSWLQTVELKKKLIVHLDADLYSSTIYVLTKLSPFIKKGDVLIFDEFNFPTDEFLAFKQFISAANFSYEFIGTSNAYLKVAIRIT